MAKITLPCPSLRQGEALHRRRTDGMARGAHRGLPPPAGDRSPRDRKAAADYTGGRILRPLVSLFHALGPRAQTSGSPGSPDVRGRRSRGLDTSQRLVPLVLHRCFAEELEGQGSSDLRTGGHIRVTRKPHAGGRNLRPPALSAHPRPELPRQRAQPVLDGDHRIHHQVLTPAAAEDLHPDRLRALWEVPQARRHIARRQAEIVAERRPEGLADGLPQTLGAFGIAARRIEGGEGRARGTAGSPPSAPTIAARNRCGGRASQHVGHFDRRRAAVVLLEHAAMAGEPYFAMSRPSGGSSRSSARNGPRGDLAQRGRGDLLDGIARLGQGGPGLQQRLLDLGMQRQVGGFEAEADLGRAVQPGPRHGSGTWKGSRASGAIIAGIERCRSRAERRAAPGPTSAGPGCRAPRSARGCRPARARPPA